MDTQAKGIQHLWLIRDQPGLQWSPYEKAKLPSPSTSSSLRDASCVSISSRDHYKRKVQWVWTEWKRFARLSVDVDKKHDATIPRKRETFSDFAFSCWIAKLKRLTAMSDHGNDFDLDPLSSAM